MNSIAELRERIVERGVRTSYSIAFTPRCGSTALTHMLTNAGFGNPTEYFQYPYEDSEYWNWLPGNTVAERLVELAGSYQGGGMFGAKLAHDHRAYLEGSLEKELGGQVTLEDVLPCHRWLYMYRRDVVDQAISAYIARSSGIWHVKEGAPAPGSLGVEYDFLAILAQVHIALVGQFHWDVFFRQRGIDPFRIVYEDFAVRQGEVLAEIRSFLLPGTDASNRSSVTVPISIPEKMSSRWQEEYTVLRERFLQDLLDWGKDSLWEKHGAPLDRWGRFFLNKGWE
ncbi:MAG: Stf0 sulfotransferase family protein [Burkholderiales bacterium]|nr:Stf0 sulfotransferase family protein [Burkholderiales bacterium]MCL4688180.1 hypothetical protein [Burkholderiales bacterium]